MITNNRIEQTDTRNRRFIFNGEKRLNSFLLFSLINVFFSLEVGLNHQLAWWVITEQYSDWCMKCQFFQGNRRIFSANRRFFCLLFNGFIDWIRVYWIISRMNADLTKMSDIYVTILTYEIWNLAPDMTYALNHDRCTLESTFALINEIGIISMIHSCRCLSTFE